MSIQETNLEEATNAGLDPDSETKFIAVCNICSNEAMHCCMATYSGRFS